MATDPDAGYFPKLLDFGIAKLLGEEQGKSKTRTGIPIGTPYYMSPEQRRGKDVDHRTDYYAFGVMTFELITGRLPFDADDVMTIMMRHLSEDPPAASDVNPALTPAIDDVIRWLMQKDPASRPPNLTAACRALEEAAGIEVPRAPVSTPIGVPMLLPP